MTSAARTFALLFLATVACAWPNRPFVGWLLASWVADCLLLAGVVSALRDDAGTTPRGRALEALAFAAPRALVAAIVLALGHVACAATHELARVVAYSRWDASSVSFATAGGAVGLGGGLSTFVILWCRAYGPLGSKAPSIGWLAVFAALW